MDEKQKDEYIAQLESIISILPGSVYWKNTEGKYLGCNDNQAKILNLPDRNGIVGKTTVDLVGQELATPLLEVDNEVMNTGVERCIEEIGPDGNGNLGTYLTKKTPLRDTTGKIIGLVGVSFDITERKKIEEELKKTREQFMLFSQEKTKFINSMSYIENIIAVLPGNVYWKDVNKRYLGCNDNVAKILKLPSRSSIIGKTNKELIGEEYALIADHTDEEVLKTGIEKELEEIGFDFDGNPAVYLTRKTPLYDENDKILGLLGISIDISERKRTEEKLQAATERAEAANRAKSEFLAMVSHELRIPLTGILGMAQLMQTEPDLPLAIQEEAADIIQSGEHLLALVDDLLDISKLEAGKMELFINPVDLKKIIEEITNILSNRAKQKNLDLQISYEETVPHLIFADARALRQILLNLVGNAIKFTKKGYITIAVTCIEHIGNQVKLAISIEDTGIGISKDKLQTIFEHFTQADNSITRQYGGTGLGLAICKSYIELMSGTISVVSEPDKGSIFTCMIPFTLQDSTIALSPWQAYKSKVKILIVDDTLRGEVIRKHIGSSLCQVASGHQAFNVLLSNPVTDNFDIVIIDNELSSINPFALGEKIKKHFTTKLPLLLLLTSDGFSASPQTAYIFFKILKKPMPPTELLIQLTATWEQWAEQTHIYSTFEALTPLKKPYVLLVEDDPIVTKVHHIMFEKLGCMVEVAHTGTEAILKTNNAIFDIIFMDIGLPDISGYEATQKIRASKENKNSNTLIIGLTGYAHEKYKTQCLEAGMNEVITKPTSLDKLKSVIKKLDGINHNHN